MFFFAAFTYSDSVAVWSRGWLWIFIIARIFANPKIGQEEIKCKCKQIQLKKQIKAWYPNKLLCVFDVAALAALISIK